MNTYKKIMPNVFGALCTEMHQKGDVIEVETRHGNTHECIVHNRVSSTTEGYLYSVTRADGFDSRQRAQNRAEKLEQYADNAEMRGADWQEKSNEGKDFLSLGEPIKIGHHSEKRHRALIEKNWKRMDNASDEYKKADGYRNRVAYWENLAESINLSMPESVEFFSEQLEEAKDYHAGLKNGKYPKLHSYSLAYSKKRVNELTKKVKNATALWG